MDESAILGDQKFAADVQTKFRLDIGFCWVMLYSMEGNKIHRMERSNIPKVYFSVVEAAAYSGVSERLMRDLISRRDIRSIRIGRRIIVRACDIDQFMESKCS